MPANARQKACLTCAKSKRKCDRQMPECQRCLDNDLDCSYPQPKRRRRDRITQEKQLQENLTLQTYNDVDILGGSLEFGNWNAADSTNPYVSLSTPFIAALSAPEPSLDAQHQALESGPISNMPCPWFLRDETWVMRQCDQQRGCVADLELEYFIRAVEEMLQSWVKNNHNSFIHRRLYAKGMPTCLQDAFTTFATYTSRTPAVKETILQITEERLSALVNLGPVTMEGAQGIRAQLARVQAFFVYVFIGLFDGSVRLRTSAEHRLPLLRQWVIRLWEALRRYRGEDGLLGHQTLHLTATEFDMEYDASSEMWQLWVLTESARRSHIIIDAVTNIYQATTKKISDCAGAVMFTARRGLWDAESAVKWFELCYAQSPLLVPSLQPGPLISEHAAEEIDDFAKLYWTFIVGADKIQSWIDRGSKPTRILAS